MSTAKTMPKIDPKVLQERMREMTRDMRNGCHTMSGDELEAEVFGFRAPKKKTGEGKPDESPQR